MLANGPGLQPKAIDEHQKQFDELLLTLKISTNLPPKEKLRLLREAKPAALRKAINKMQLTQFRAVTDGHFVKSTLFQELQDGTFARKLIASNVQVLIGESELEHFGYAGWKSPANNPQAVYQRLLVDYPRWAADVLKEKYFKDNTLPEGVKSWKELFGRIYADVQIHATERGFVDSLCRHGAKDLVHRYRIDWRSDVTWAPKKWGATHWADNVVWFFGDGKTLPSKERDIVVNALIGEYAKYVSGNEVDWKASAPLEIRRLRKDGEVDVWKDEWWDKKLEVWNALQEASAKQDRGGKKANL